jgi:hypothetical protein
MAGIRREVGQIWLCNKWGCGPMPGREIIITGFQKGVWDESLIEYQYADDRNNGAPVRRMRRKLLTTYQNAFTFVGNDKSEAKPWTVACPYCSGRRVVVAARPPRDGICDMCR